jgi:hypothetical protein
MIIIEMETTTTPFPVAIDATTYELPKRLGGFKDDIRAEAAAWINDARFVLERDDRLAADTFSPYARERNDYCESPKTYTRWKVRFADDMPDFDTLDYCLGDTGWCKTRKEATAAAAEFIERIYHYTLHDIREAHWAER